MTVHLAEEIMLKSATLPLAQQQEVLAFVESKLRQRETVEVAAQNKPFRSVRGILHRQLDHLEEDLQEVRREMWANFPREEPQ